MKKVKHILKLFLRDIPTSLLMIVSLTLAYTVAVNGIVLLTDISAMQKKSAEGINHNDTNFMINLQIDVINQDEETIKLEKWIDDLKGIDCDNANMILTHCDLNLGDGLGMDGYSNIILGHDVSLEEDIIDGRMPTEEELESGQKVILVNADYRDDVKKQNGQEVIECEDELFKVIGYYKSNDISRACPTTISFIESYNGSVRHALALDMFYCGFSGLWIYGEGTEQVLQQAEGILRRYNYLIDTESLKEDMQQIHSREKLNKVFMMILFVFCVADCIVVAELWIKVRFRNLVIMRTMGCSVLQILEHIVAYLFKYSILSVIFSIILQCKLSELMGSKSVFHGEIVHTSLYIITAMLFVITITIIRPFFKIKRIIPANDIKN